MYGNIRVLSQHASPNSISVFGWKRTTSGFFVVTVFLCTCSRPPSTNLEEVKADWYSEFTANKYFDPNCRKVLLGSRFFLWGSESGIRLFVCLRAKMEDWSIDSPSAFWCWFQYQSCPVTLAKSRDSKFFLCWWSRPMTAGKRRQVWCNDEKLRFFYKK